MSSAALLRKTLLSLLQEKILPELDSKNALRIVTARLPLKVPVGVVVREMPYPPLEEPDSTTSGPKGINWSAVHMHALNYPTLYYLIEGEADLLMGVTTSMLSQIRAQDKPERPTGGYMISLSAPSYFLIPPGVPRRTGALPPWYRSEPHVGTLRTFNIRALPIGALCNLTTMHDGVFDAQYSLLIEDDQLAVILSVLLNEQSTPAPNSRIGHTLLLALMLRLQRGLNSQIPPMTDGLYSRFPESDPTYLRSELLHHPVIERTHKFIQLHLHEALTPATIATHIRMTPRQLNRIFQANTGMSTMHYVTMLRMESAQRLLHTSDLSVQEISRLVGYRQLAHFSRTFHQHTGRPPLQFRRNRNSANS